MWGVHCVTRVHAHVCMAAGLSCRHFVHAHVRISVPTLHHAFPFLCLLLVAWAQTFENGYVERAVVILRTRSDSVHFREDRSNQFSVLTSLPHVFHA